MRHRLAFAITALTVLAACDQAPGPKGGARAPIGTAATPAAGPAKPAAAPNCPTVAPACPPKVVAASPKAKAHRVKRTAAAHQATGRSKPKANGRKYAYVDEGPAAGLPPRPYRYDELYPPPRWERDDLAEEREMRRRHRRDGYAEHGHRHGGRYGEGLADDDHRQRRYESYSEGRSRHSARAYAEERSSYSEQGYSSFAEEDCRCGPRAQAAGFDDRGFLTWPGKTPAR